jgi:hypothetical protein
MLLSELQGRDLQVNHGICLDVIIKLSLLLLHNFGYWASLQVTSQHIFVDFRHFGWQINNRLKAKANVVSMQDCDTDCGCCFCLSTLKSYNGPQLCSGRLNKRFLPPKMAD